MNLKDDYTSKIIELNPDYEGEVNSVLTASNYNDGNRSCVLYLHGFDCGLDLGARIRLSR